MSAELATGDRVYGQMRFVARSLIDPPATAQAIVRDVRSRVLPPIIERTARAVRLISPRPRYLWQYAYAAIPPTTLSSVAPELEGPLTTLKVCASILFTAIDDVADELRNLPLYRRLVAEVFHGARRAGGPRDKPVDRVVRHLRASWRFLRGRALAFPHGAELLDLLDFDAHTLVHGMGHSLLVGRRPEAICEEEQVRWSVSSFYMAVFADLDLMCSPGLRLEELGAIREIVGQAQEMCAIANWVGTWEREVRRGDHSSGFVATALCNGVIEVSDLRGGIPGDELVARLRCSDVEAVLLGRWERCWRLLDARRERIATFDVGRYLGGLERYLELQLASRGLV